MRTRKEAQEKGATLAKRSANFYDTWIDEQAAKIEAAMRDAGRKGLGFNFAVYVVPSAGPVQGELVMAVSRPESATDVLRFPAQGSRIMAVPYPHLRSLLWNACRSMPILPVHTP